MKKLILIIFISAGLTANAQNVLRVNNMASLGAPYQTIQDAIAAANDGDILLVEGSPNNYDVGNLILSKRLTIKGPGYLLSENVGIQATQNTYPASLVGTSATIISIAPGSEGTVLSGLTFSARGISIQTSNVTISNNHFTSSASNGGIRIENSSPASNLLITGNHMNGALPNIYFGNSGVYVNILISNNYLSTGISGGSSSTTYGTLKNNVIDGEVRPIYNFDIANNIFLAASNAIQTAVNSTIRNNVFVASSQPGADGTNVFNQSIASLFIGLTGNTTDTQWKIKAGSPALTAGEGGIECGMYGGITPYRISGVVSGQPTITGFTVPGNVSQNGMLNVKVSAKVN